MESSILPESESAYAINFGMIFSTVSSIFSGTLTISVATGFFFLPHESTNTVRVIKHAKHNKDLRAIEKYIVVLYIRVFALNSGMSPLHQDKITNRFYIIRFGI